MGNTIINSDKNNYRIVLAKTIEMQEPIYYRIVDLSSYTTSEIPAYRLLDEIITNNKHIVNIRCENNKIYIIDEDGYDSAREVVLIDEFDTEIQDIYDFALSHGDIGSTIIKRYSAEKNRYSMSNYRVDSNEQLAWTCEAGHTIYSDFATYFGTKCNCPICDAQSNGKVMSLKYWARITHNNSIVESYDEACELNNKDSRHRAWNSRKIVTFKKGNQVIEERLCDITSGLKKLQFNEDKVHINLTRKTPKQTLG